MSPDPDKTLVDWAERDLRCFGDDLSREQAAVVLAMWSPMVKLREESLDAAAEVTALILSRFPAELVPVAGVDFLVPQAVACNCFMRGGKHSFKCDIARNGRPQVEVTAQPTAEAVQS